MNKGNSGLIFLIILLFVVVIAMCGVILYFQTRDNDNYTPSEQTNNNVGTNNAQPPEDNNDNEVSSTVFPNSSVKKIKKVDETKDIVYLSYSKTTGSYSHFLPIVNIDSEYADSINQEITDSYAINEEESVHYNLNYFSYLNDNILSLVVTSEINDYTSYKVYNIDIYTGNKVSNTDIVGRKNISVSTYLENLKEASKNKFIERFGTELSEDEWYKQMLNQTIASENNTINAPIYLDENGDIWAIVKIYSLAGPMSFNVAAKVM